MYADEAREATRKEMKKEMRKRENEKSRRQVFRMFSKGYPQTEIADVLEIPLKTVKRWCAGLTPATEKQSAECVELILFSALGIFKKNINAEDGENLHPHCFAQKQDT